MVGFADLPRVGQSETAHSQGQMRARSIRRIRGVWANHGFVGIDHWFSSHVLLFLASASVARPAIHVWQPPCQMTATCLPAYELPLALIGNWIVWLRAEVRLASEHQGLFVHYLTV